ncbi:MAG: hypothetical protein ACLPTF_19585 [Steroidobacteraceae bacterium]
MATFNDLSDAELGKLLRSRYDRLCAAHDMGLSDQHPSERWAEDTETLKAYREAAATGGIAGKVAGTDNPPDFEGKPDNPALSVPPRPTQDSKLGIYVRGLDHAVRFVPHGGQMLPGDVQVAMPDAVSTTAASTRAMTKTIPGYRRLG